MPVFIRFESKKSFPAFCGKQIEAKLKSEIEIKRFLIIYSLLK